MVANIGFINSNVEATAYISAVAAFAAIVLVVLLFLGRRWCHSTAFNRKCRDGILPVNPRVAVEPCSPLNNVPFDALSKPNNFPERIYAYEGSDSDDELRLRIQEKEEVECHYEEKNENVCPSTKLDVELVETALRETSLRETRRETGLRETSLRETGLRETSLRETGLRETSLRETGLRETSLRETGPRESSIRETKIDQVVCQRADYIHTLEAQSSVDSDGLAHNDTSLLCAESGSQDLGSVELTLLYDAPVRCMTVHVLQARALLQKNPQLLQSQVRIVLLPLKKQKVKTKIRIGENPQYMESFVLHKINPEDVHGLGLRVRIYSCERMRRHRLLGEASVSFATLNLELENSLWLQLAPRQHHQPGVQLPKLELASPMSGVLASPSISTVVSPMGGEACSLARSESASSCCSTRSAPELLLGLQYNASTGHLTVEVIKGTHFRKLSPNKSPDTYVKLSLISSLGMEMGSVKTTTRRAQSNPLYKELFIFQVALFQLTEVTLMVSVWWRRSVKRNEMVGWFSLGHSYTGRDEQRHWDDLCERHHQVLNEMVGWFSLGHSYTGRDEQRHWDDLCERHHQVQRWHVLLNS